jgi:hypothetical protein
MIAQFYPGGLLQRASVCATVRIVQIESYRKLSKWRSKVLESEEVERADALRSDSSTRTLSRQMVRQGQDALDEQNRAVQQQRNLHETVTQAFIPHQENPPVSGGCVIGNKY